ncbi:MAG: tetratricopeptide repeat protein [Acidobacteriota bacterium]
MSVRVLVVGLWIALLALPARPQARPSQQATATQSLAALDANPTLFATLAAINAAGYDTDIDSPSNNPLRKQLRDHLAKLNIPILPALRRFVRDHKKPNAAEDLGQYISFALLSKGAPDFGPAMPNFPPPADADGLHELPALLAAFYRDADVPALWEAVQPAVEAALSQYTDPVSRAIQGVNAYLRNPQNPLTKGRFQVFVDLLGAPNQAHARIYLDEYFVVLTPSAEPRIDEIRHHYLRFWSDSIGFRYADGIYKLRSLGDFALGSPLLTQQYRDDFSLLAVESFVRAMEARITKQPEQVTQAMREGFVLAPAFADLLPKYETQTDTMREYFGDLLKGIDMRREAVRLAKIDFVTERATRVVRVTVPAKPPVLTGVAKTLQDAEDLFDKKDYAGARSAWNALLANTAEKPPQARAYYGLGRVALSDRDPERADQLFRKVLELQPDASTQAWSLLYLGKLADSQGEAESAKQFYQQSLAVAGLPDQVKREAQQGLSGAFFKPRAPEPEQ